MGLETYRKKRKFNVTSEPRGRIQSAGGHRYVIQKHDATRLHYDLRLELDGVMKSWAVTRGPSLDPNDKRLAVHVEDHPIAYNTFEGIIPEGEYGGGTVMIWDRGTWSSEGDPHKGYAKGHLEFTLHGKKLRGRWHLVRMRPRPGDRRDVGRDNWLLIKAKDEEARSGRNADILDAEPLSAATGRSMDEIAVGKGKRRVWHSNRGSASADPPKATGRPQSQREFKAQLKVFGAVRTKPQRKAAAATKTAKRPAAKRHAPTKPAAAKVERKSGGGPRQDRSRDRSRGHISSKVSGKARLPDFVPPSLAMLHDGAPSSKNWLHEIKFDGYRIEARLDRGEVRLLTRKKLDWTRRFEPIAEAVRALPAGTALIDGELVVEDGKGISNFSLLQSDLKDGRNDRFVYRAFDLLFLDGKDLTGEPLVERKAALQRLLKGESREGRIRYVEHFDEDGPAVFRSACEMQLEGIVSKLRDAPYRSGRSDNFIKVKCHNAQEFVVVGFSPSAAMPKAVGALIAAFHEHGKLRYAGRIGTGYTRSVARDLWQRLAPLRADKPPVALPPDERRKDVVWVKPKMVIEAEFRGITHDGLLRQASFKGLREDKPAREVVREMPAAAMAQRQPMRRSGKSSSRPSQPGAEAKGSGMIAGIRLSHPDRVYWADAGVTKEDLAGYYVGAWDVMAPHIVGRPLAVLRCPEGTAGECFFQKHIASNIKASPLRHVVKAKQHDVIAVEKLAELIELVQSGALEVHVRGSRLDSLETCDRIVFDLDPGEGVAWKEVVAGAKEIRDRLAALKLKSFAKLSGGKGIHVVLPIADADWDAAKSFSAAIAAAMAADSPKQYLAKMTKALRHGRIFIDYLRNTREATSVAVYSTRARAGAPVSMPVSWEALARTTSGHQFTLPDLTKLPAKDAWADLGKVRQKLPEIARKRR